MAEYRDDFAYGTPLGEHWINGDQWEPHDEFGWYGWVWPIIADGEAVALWDQPSKRRHYTGTVETLVYRFGGGGVIVGAELDLSSYYLLAYRSTAQTSDPDEPWHMRLSLEKVVSGGTTVLWETEEDTPPLYPYLVFNRQKLQLTLAEKTLRFQYDNMRGRQRVSVPDSDMLTGRYSGMYARVATRPPYPKLGGWNNWWALNWSDDCPVFIVVDLAANKAFPCVNLAPGDGETFTEDDGILDFSDAAYQTEEIGDTMLLIDGEE